MTTRKHNDVLYRRYVSYVHSMQSATGQVQIQQTKCFRYSSKDLSLDFGRTNIN